MRISGEANHQELVHLDRCQVCGSTLLTEHSRTGEWRLSSCDACSFVFLNPRPAKSYYAELYSPLSQYEYKVDGIEYYRKKDDFIRAYHQQLEQLERFVPKGRLLEVGSALGFFLESARQRGWEPFGIELSPAGVSYCRETFDIDAFCGEILEARLPSRYFDCLVTIHTLEHVYDPRAFIAEAARLLRTCGLFVVEVPYLPDPEERHSPVLREDFPAHLSIFSRDTLVRLISQEGFVPVEIQEGEHLRIIAKKGTRTIRVNSETTLSLYETLTGLGERFYQKGLIEEAFTCFSALKEIFPDELEVWNNLGTVLWSLGKKEIAWEILLTALSMDEQYWNCLVNLEIMAKEMEKQNEVRPFLDRYMSSIGKSHNVKNTLKLEAGQETGVCGHVWNLRNS